MRQHLKKLYFYSPDEKNLFEEVNNFLKNAATANVLDVEFGYRLERVNIEEEAEASTVHKEENYTYLHYAIITYLIEEEPNR